MKISCQSTTGMASLSDSGILVSTAYGGADETYSTCSLSDEVRNDQNHPWMQYFHASKFEEILMRQCEGRSECVAEFNLRDFTDKQIAKERMQG